MSPTEIASLRKSLRLTQEQFAQLLGVHSLTISKWERGVLHPTPYQTALMHSFGKASQRKPELGEQIATALVVAGVGVALFYLLRAAFEEN